MLSFPVHEALSGVSGSISLACWIFVLVPQLVENFQKKNSDGISLWFLAVWFVGDVTNLIGAVWAGLVPTVIALAIYFCIADTVLIIQCLYYKKLSILKTGNFQSSQHQADEASEPLLGQRNSEAVSPVSTPFQSQTSHSRPNGNVEPVAQNPVPDIPQGASLWLKNIVAVLAVCTIGATGWVIAWKTGLWIPTIEDDEEPGRMTDKIGATILGYISALCYLGARIPQIFKNFREKSCDGLAILFFVLSLVGNITYGGGIMFHSVSRDYIITNLPWLIGSLGTIGEDLLIFVQFRIYRRRDEECKNQAIA